MENELRCSVEFDDKLSKAIESSIKKMPSKVVETLWKVAYLIEARAKMSAQSNFEHPTGNLPASLHSEVDTHQFSASVGTNLEYARLREFGGTVDDAWGRGVVAHHEGRPYLTPALESERNKVIEFFKKLCGDVLNDIERQSK